MRDIKQVIIVRKDLKMRKGKIAAQSAHASMKILADRMHKVSIEDIGSIEYRLTPTNEMIEWLDGIFTKIALGVDSLEELTDLAEKANELNIPTAIIEDNGLTVFNGKKTVTCMAIGPALSEDIDKITGHLKLL